MLILSRRIDEALWIGDDVTIKVLGVSGNQVSLGIEASEGTKIHREEIYSQILREENDPKETDK